MTMECKYIWFRKTEFVAKTLFLSAFFANTLGATSISWEHSKTMGATSKPWEHSKTMGATSKPREKLPLPNLHNQ